MKENSTDIKNILRRYYEQVYENVTLWSNYQRNKTYQTWHDKIENMNTDLNP